MFERGFKASKCKGLLNSVISRISQVRNKRGAQIRQSRKDVAQLLQSGQDTSARKRVDIVIREQSILDAYALLEKFCEFVLARISAIKAEKNCPLDMQEAISSLIFAGPRCADLPELLELRSIFEEHFGKKFVIAAAERQSGCGVNELIIEKLSGRPAYDGVRVQLMKEIAAENRVHWSPKDSDGISKDVHTEKRVSIKEHAGKISIPIQDEASDDSAVLSSKRREDSPSSHTSNSDKVQVVPPLPSLPKIPSIDSPPPPAAILDKEQFIPFVPSTSRKSSSSGDFLEEETQFVPFLSFPYAPKESIPSHRTLEAGVSEVEDVNKLFKQKPVQSEDLLEGERDDRWAVKKSSKKNEAGIDFVMASRNGLSKNSCEAISTKEDSSLLPGENLHNQQSKIFCDGDEVKAVNWKQSKSQMSINASHVLLQKDVEDDLELHYSQPISSKPMTNSRGRVENDFEGRGSMNADDLPTSKQQSEIKRPKTGFQEDGLQLRRSKDRADFAWNPNNKETLYKSFDYEDESVKSKMAETIRDSMPSKYPEHGKTNSSLHNQRKGYFLGNSSADASSESDENGMLDQRMSTNTQMVDYSNVRFEEELSSEEEFNIELSAVREPILELRIHAGAHAGAHDGNDFGVLKDLSHAQRVHRSHGSVKTHISKQDIGSSIVDTEKSSDLLFRRGANSNISGGGGSVQDNFVCSKRDESQHFGEDNMHSLSKQSSSMKREGVLAGGQRLELKHTLQTGIGLQNYDRIQYLSSFDSSTIDKDKQLQCKIKHPDERGFLVGVHDLSEINRVSGKLVWHSVHREEEDNSLSSSDFQPQNVIEHPDEKGFLAGVHDVSENNRVTGKLVWHSAYWEEEDNSLSSGDTQPQNVSNAHLGISKIYSQAPVATVKQLPQITKGLNGAKNHPSVSSSLTRSKRTIGVSVRSQSSAKADEGSKSESSGNEASAINNQSVEASSSIYPTTYTVRNDHNELSSKGGASNNASSESNSAQKVSRLPYTRTRAAESTSAQQTSSRRTWVACPATDDTHDGEKLSTGTEANHGQETGKNSSSLARMEVEKGTVQDASTKGTDSHTLERESRVHKKALHPSSQPEHTSFNSKHLPSKVTASSNLPPLSTIAQTTLYSDDDLLARFQALKANLY